MGTIICRDNDFGVFFISDSKMTAVIREVSTAVTQALSMQFFGKPQTREGRNPTTDNQTSWSPDLTGVKSKPLPWGPLTPRIKKEQLGWK